MAAAGNGSPLEIELVKQINSLPHDELVCICEMINRVIDFDQVCGERADTMVAAGICNELDDLKLAYDGIHEFLAQTSRSELQKFPREVVQLYKNQLPCIVYIPQVGYRMRFEKTHPPRTFLESHPDMRFAFEGEDCHGYGYFYHTSKTDELDTRIGDIFHKILDMESILLRELEELMLEHQAAVLTASEVAATVDCFVSLSLVAREKELVRPTVVHEDVIHIQNGRHILQELTVPTFVPNDTDVGIEGRVNVITGPNTSGKSIYVKQVAIIVFLAHVGSYVPAESCTVGLTDRMFTRIAYRETSVLPQSSFVSDLHQLSAMFKHATPRSLCIIDEFGKGTLATDGVGLLAGALNYFSMQKSPPKVLVCTHFGEVMNDQYLEKSNQLRFHTMSVLVGEQEGGGPSSSASAVDNSDVNCNITLLYRLVPGVSVSSFGVHCGKLAGYPHDILKRALYLLGKDGPVQRWDRAQQARKDLKYEETYRKFMSFDLDTQDVRELFKLLHHAGDEAVNMEQGEQQDEHQHAQENPLRQENSRVTALP